MLSMRTMRNKNQNKHARIILFVITFFYSALTDKCYGTPLNNVFDMQPIYSVLGTDKYYKERCQSEISFHISPFYQQTSTARNNHGKKVPAGNRLGKWNLFGLFFGTDGAPTQSPLNFNVNGPNFINLRTAQKEIKAITMQVPVTTAGSGTTPPVTDRYRVGPETPFSSTPLKLPVFDGGLTNEENFDPNRDLFAYVTVPANYEKIGVRSQLNFDAQCGLGISVKCGFVDVKQYLIKKSPQTLFVLDPIFARDAFGGSQLGTIPPIPTGTPDIPLPTGTPTASDNDVKDAPQIFRALFDFPPIEDISEDLDFDLTVFHKTCAEDTHIQVYWHFPITYKEKSGDTVLTMVPYIAAGVWLPTGSNYRSDKAFSVATGNDGFFGFTAETSLAFDFPILPKTGQTLQGNFGGGILLFAEKSKFDQRFPTSEYQNGFYPWRIAHLKKRPGLTWYLNGSMKSENFIDGLSIYMDFVYTQHLKDRITLADPDPVRNEAFGKAIDEYRIQTAWKNQQVNVGFDYQLADPVSIGGALQAHISGVRVYRSLTLLGGVTISF